MQLVSDLIDEENSNSGERCALILDHFLYGRYKRCLYRLLSSAGLRIPLIFYNAPDIEPSCRFLRWLSENEIEYECMDFDPFIPLFEKIDMALADFDSCPADAACPPEQCFVPKLPPSMAALYAFLSENRNREISIEEIAVTLNISSKRRIQRNNLTYAYIARLRKCLESNSSVRIIRSKKNFYRLVLD